ncbi:MAG: hypothetical protein ABSB76_05380 [Streptosporangiaceae bacterium]
MSSLDEDDLRAAVRPYRDGQDLPPEQAPQPELAQPADPPLALDVPA